MARRGVVVVLVVAALATVLSTLPASATTVEPSARVSVPVPIVEHYECIFHDGPPRWFAVDLAVTGSIPTTTGLGPLVVSDLTVGIPSWITGGGPGASVSDVGVVVRAFQGGLTDGVEVTDPGGPVSPSTGFTTAVLPVSVAVLPVEGYVQPSVSVRTGDVTFTVHAMKGGDAIDRGVTCDIGDATVTPIGTATVLDPVLVGLEVVRADLIVKAASLSGPTTTLVRSAADALGLEGVEGLIRLGAHEPTMRALFGAASQLQLAIDQGAPGLVADRHRLAAIGQQLAARSLERWQEYATCGPDGTQCDPFRVAQLAFKLATYRLAIDLMDQGKDVLAIAAFRQLIGAM